MLYDHVIPPHLTRHGTVGKVRRPDGDPVADLKDMTRFTPVPTTPPGNLKVPFALFDPKADKAALTEGKLVFHCVGDVGGIHGTATQDAIAVEMEKQVKNAAADSTPAFFYILGDVIYFNGQSELYKSEFYEPYQYYPKLIFAIPGNHDGDTAVRKGDTPDTEPSLTGFLDNFCSSQPTHASPYRMTMTQPYVYWTMDAPFVTMIGLYSNVEGSLDARGRMDQQNYLEAQMKSADPAKKLIIAVHHPPYSLDTAHGGNPEILAAIDRAIAASGRFPDAVLSGHVHNYQRFSRTIQGHTIPYVVAGAGGYANDGRSLHKLQAPVATAKMPYQTTLLDVELKTFNEVEPGFLRVTVDAKSMLIEYFLVPFDGKSPGKLFDSVTI